ncbi:helix-turn-helix transcriptional regulator [Microbacteriaceae bacterium VKM Ac-2855]|nr:helix-turn-helix transcriptional regulator [Microbacteriaceae bacterium VKM Ac-2855]
MLLRHAIGAVVREHRLAQGLTLRDLSRACRVSLPYLSEIERGRKEASSEILEAICGALGIELWRLVRDIAEMLLPSTLDLAAEARGASTLAAGLSRADVRLAA